MIQVPALEHVVQPEHQPDGVCGSPNPLLRFVGADDAAEDVVQQALEVLVSKPCQPASPESHHVQFDRSITALQLHAMLSALC